MKKYIKPEMENTVLRTDNIASLNDWLTEHSEYTADVVVTYALES